jgi:hypothetical protein
VVHDGEGSGGGLSAAHADGTPPPQPDRRPVIGHPDDVSVAQGRGQHEPQAIDGRRKFDGSPQLLTYL